MHSTSKNYSELQPEERVTLASLKQQNYSIRAMGRVLGRYASTISRELRRNSAQGYTRARPRSTRAASVGAAHARQLNCTSTRPCLFGLVQHFLQLRWSPEQLALKLACIYPRGHKYRVSHETIYNCIYAQPVGELI